MSSSKIRFEPEPGYKTIQSHERLPKRARGAVLHYCPLFDGDYPPAPASPTVAFNMLGFIQKMGGHMMYPPLLLFDQIEVPSSSSIERDPEFAFLFDNGHAVSTGITVHGEANNAVIRRDAFDVWSARDQKEPGAWSIWYLDGDTPIPDDQSDPTLGFQLQLQNTLVLPDPNVPIEDLINFRDRRKSELMALRHHVDELSIAIAKNGPDPRASRLALEKFELAQEDHLRVSLEPNWKKFLGNLNVTMNWTEALAGSVAALPVATTPLGAAGGIAAGLVSALAVRSARGLKEGHGSSPFAYMAQIHKEFVR